MIEKPEQTCRAVMQQTGNELAPSTRVNEALIESDDTIRTDLRLPQAPGLTPFLASHFKSGDKMFQIARLPVESGDLARGNDPGK